MSDMYSRNFFTDDKNVPTPPENYSGTAISGEEAPADKTPASPCAECKDEKCAVESESVFSSLFGGGISGLLGGRGIKSIFSHIGTEEMIIIAVALFLLFSKEGDKECAIMLLLLLLV